MPKIPPKVFIDTNVWFSAFFGSPNSEKLLKAHVDKKIEAIVSQEVIIELVRNIKKKFPAALSSVQDLFESIPTAIVKNPNIVLPQIENLAHPKDQLIFQAAVNAKIKIFVTGNTRHFEKDKIEKKLKIQILTPKQAVEKLKL